MNVDEAVATLHRQLDAANPDGATAFVARAPLRLVLARLAEHKRTQATGGPAPAMTRDWGNEQHVPPPESAARADMAPPARYGASNQKRSEP